MPSAPLITPPTIHYSHNTEKTSKLQIHTHSLDDKVRCRTTTITRHETATLFATSFSPLGLKASVVNGCPRTVFAILFNKEYLFLTAEFLKQGNYIHDGTASPFAAGTTHASWQMSSAPRPNIRTRLLPGYRSVSPTGNRMPAQVRPSAMASVLRTGNVQSRKYFAMLDAGRNADMARRTRREWPASNWRPI